MADEEPSRQSTGGEVDRWVPQNLPGPAAPSPEELEQFRRFQEFQRFQDFQRSQEFPPQQPQVPAPAPDAHPAMHEQLAGMRADLTELRASQARTERAVNPPLWRKILRSGWTKGLVGLIVVILGITWAVNHFFGGSDVPSGGSQSPTSNLPEERASPSPKNAVGQVYQYIAKAALASPAELAAGNGQKKICATFKPAAAQKFARQLGAPNCEAVFGHVAVSDPDSYEQVDLRQLRDVPDGATTMVIDSCTFPVSGGPRLGSFTLTKEGQGWLITDVAPSHCG